MSRSLILSFNAAVVKYSRLNKKVRKSISRGEFWRLTQAKRHSLLQRIERLKRRITELQFQLKLTSAGLAAGLLMMSAGEASAQLGPSTLGPFVENPAANPFPKPSFFKRRNPNLTFWDFDSDGDLDASLASSESGYTSLEHFRNTGTKQNPTYKSFYDSRLEVHRYSGSSDGRVAFADVDDDGDLDAVMGMDRSDDGDPILPDDSVFFYRNNAEFTTDLPAFYPDNSNEQPFKQMRIKKESWPAFTDFDKDGDLDFVLAGEYDDESTGKTAWIQFFRNDKVGHTPGDAQYHQLFGSENPLYLGESTETSTARFFQIAFADLDGDGDDDFIKTDQHGQPTYKRNDGGVFVEQSGAYTYNPNGTSTGNPLSMIGAIPLSTLDSYRSLSFADLDGDGDKDLVVGTNNIGTLNSQYIYVENTGHGVMVPDQSYGNPISGLSMGNNTTATLFDYDKDGDEDFLTTGRVSVPIGSENQEMDVIAHLFFKNNNGVFEQQTLLNDPFAALVKQGSDGEWQAIDVDGDSDLDALFKTYEYDANLFRYIMHIQYYSNDNGAFVAVDDSKNPLQPILDVGFNYVDLSFGDLNDDGLPDGVAIGNSNTPYFFENTGTIGKPVFEMQNLWKDGLSTELNGLRPKLVDLDNDGDNDLILGKYYYIYYYENIGNSKTPRWKEYQQQYTIEGATYNLENPFGTIQGEGGVAPELADLDGDGDKDLLYASDNRGYFTYYENKNPAPTVVPGSTLSLTFEVGKPVKLAPLATIADADSDKLRKIEIKAEPYQQGIEKLQLTSAHGALAVSWIDSTGVLTISGNGTYLEYQSALRDVEYVFLGGNGGNKTSGRHSSGKAVQKTVTVFTLDSDLTVGPSNTIVFTISGDDGTLVINTPPAISGTATPFYVKNELVINNNIVIVDPDSVLTAATAVFTAGFIASEDILLFTDQNGITGLYNSTAGLLSLSGSASVADYQAALRSVRYKNSSATPSTQDRAITFTVSDGGPQISLAGTVIRINKPPVITAEDKQTAAKGNVAFSVNEVLFDPDNNLDLSTLQVTSQQGGQVIIANGVITVDYNAVPNFEGNDVITITVCDIGGRCNTTTLSVEVGAAAKIYTGLSPNGDGINDWFQIDFLPQGTHVAIYNRWGDAIFETDDYDINEPSKRFEGKNKNGTEVIAGSYFYKVKFPDRKKVETGYLLLNR